MQGMWGEGGPGTSGGSISRSCPLHRPDAHIMAADALQLVRRPLKAVNNPCCVGHVHGLIKLGTTFSCMHASPACRYAFGLPASSLRGRCADQAMGRDQARLGNPVLIHDGQQI